MPRKSDALTDLTRLYEEIARDCQHPALLAGRLPPGWARIDDRPQPEQVRVTLRMDKDVARFFRSYGQGYQSLIAKVLRAFMLSTVTELRALAEADADSDALEVERMLASQLEELRARRMSW